MPQIKIEISVHYSPETVTPDLMQHLAQHIGQILDYQIGNGMLTGDTEAEADVFNVEVKVEE